jgi:Uncharacterized protein conserved in bacteria (DUF2325)
MPVDPLFKETLRQGDGRRFRPLTSMGRVATPELILRAEPKPSPSRRTKLWELHNYLHCSIIGTCLSTRELRNIVARFAIAGADELDEHGLHKTVVGACGRQSDFARYLHRALDKRHQAAIHQFARHKTAGELRQCWDEAAERGEIPGGYWATLTHPAATEEIVANAFGTIHMLSHLVGAANRADIRRLCQLEREKEDLVAKVERQQTLLRDGFIERDRKINELTEALARRIGMDHRDLSRPSPEGHDVMPGIIADLERRLSAETARRERAERGKFEAEGVKTDLTAMLTRKDREASALRAELDRIEAILTADQRLDSDPAPRLELSGLSLLYVGGRANQVSHIRVAAERAGARFLDHDGGMEDRDGRLPGLVSRADIVLFPVDCVSHTAALALKRLCRQAEKPWFPLRNASLTCFLAAAGDFAAPHGPGGPGTG